MSAGTIDVLDGVDPPAVKWRLITTCRSTSPEGRARWNRVLAAARAVLGLPDSAGSADIETAREASALFGARDSWAIACLAAYARLLDDTAAPVDRIALPFARSPEAGDAVRLAASWRFDTGLPIGSVGVLGGRLGQPWTGGSVVFNAHTYRDEQRVNCGGGPGSIHTELAELSPTGATTKLRCWRFKNGHRRAHNTEEFTVTVPVWNWYPNNRGDDNP